MYLGHHPSRPTTAVKTNWEVSICRSDSGFMWLNRIYKSKFSMVASLTSFLTLFHSTFVYLHRITILTQRQPKETFLKTTLFRYAANKESFPCLKEIGRNFHFFQFPSNNYFFSFFPGRMRVTNSSDLLGWKIIVL